MTVGIGEYSPPGVEGGMALRDGMGRKMGEREGPRLLTGVEVSCGKLLPFCLGTLGGSGVNF